MKKRRYNQIERISEVHRTFSFHRQRIDFHQSHKQLTFKLDGHKLKCDRNNSVVKLNQHFTVAIHSAHNKKLRERERKRTAS